MTREDPIDPVKPELDVAAGIVRAFEEAAGAVAAESEAKKGQPDSVRMLDEAFERAQAALGTNVLPFRERTPKS